MDYIYDIVLNFQKDYYDFYEWKPSDKIINIKKIPVYLINNQDYLNLKYNEVILDNTKNIPKMFLVTNGLEVMGILLDKYNKIVKKSSLLLEEAEEVLEDKNSIQNLTLTYKKNILKPHKFSSRIQIEKIKFIEKFFNNIDINKDKYLLKYIYYDIFKQEIKSILKIHSELKNLIYTDLDKIYHSIKKITIELKQ